MRFGEWGFELRSISYSYEFSWFKTGLWSWQDMNGNQSMFVGREMRFRREQNRRGIWIVFSVANVARSWGLDWVLPSTRVFQLKPTVFLKLKFSCWFDFYQQWCTNETVPLNYGSDVNRCKWLFGFQVFRVWGREKRITIELCWLRYIRLSELPGHTMLPYVLRNNWVSTLWVHILTRQEPNFRGTKLELKFLPGLIKIESCAVTKPWSWYFPPRSCGGTFLLS
jgi:hypothetical protein